MKENQDDKEALKKMVNFNWLNDIKTSESNSSKISD